MEYYSQGIRKFERELNVSVTEFPQFGLIGLKMPYERDAENAFYSRSYDQTQRESEDYELQLNQEQEPNLYSTEYSRSYDQTQRESEDYELQLNQEQEPNLYSTEQEPNLLKEQAEYNKRIRGEMYGAYFDEW